MDEDVWEFHDEVTGKSVRLHRTDPLQYEIHVDDDYNAAAVDLTKKQLVEMFYAIGREIGAL